MRTRNAGTPKTPPTSKTPSTPKTPATSKTPATQKKKPTTTPKTPTPPPDTPVSPDPPAAVAAAASPSLASPSSQPPLEQEKASTEGDAAGVAPPAKGATAPKKKVMKTRKVIKKVLRPKNPASAKAATAAAVEVRESEDVKGNCDKKDDDMTDLKDEQCSKEELGTQMTEGVGAVQEKGENKMDVDDLPAADNTIVTKTESPGTEVAAKAAEEEPSETIDGQEEVKSEERIEGVTSAAAAEMLESEQEPQDQLDSMDEENLENTDDKLKPENTNDVHAEEAEDAEEDAPVAEEIEDYGDEEGFVEPGEDDLREEDEPETAEDMSSNEENKELAAVTKERKIEKEHEIFVRGLDLEVVEEDVKKAFENAGEVVEVRLLKDPCTKKNRGFAFVRFATKDQVKKALSEMKNPVICGKRCGTSANEDNDTLFVGNICNTWTKEAINQKLKDYNLEGVEHITLVQDPRQEGLSRGFCFVQFACHADAMSAYKRLQKPDVIFGHAERTVKVAFSEPLQEPDPEVMAKVKSVFVDGLPPYWDEDRVRKHFKTYGEIERVSLARNISTAKRKDFGFVDYTTHEAALACIEDVNGKEIVDGNSKIKVRARLSNPLPKMQAVKGGMCGGFRIGQPNGRSLGRPGPPTNRPNFQHGRMSRGSFNSSAGPSGRRAPHRGGHGAPGANASARPFYGGPRHGLIEHGPVRPIPPFREPFPLDDGVYSRPFMGRRYDEPYMYDGSPGLKRPFYMTEQDPTYMEPSRVRPRFDYTGGGRGPHFRDTFGAGNSMYSSGYYGDYGALPHSSFNARDRSYGSVSRGGAGGGRGGGGGRGYYY